ncbi:MAG: ABC transporter substrate-binding protein [Candidatus Eisenbacteria sp.]|nr:ABC transporter substrate-binding protein [Candidatus Eisenbacteria bacterium]
MKEINNAGGILGQDVKLLIRDSQTDPDKAASTASDMIDGEGVPAIIGAASSGVSQKVLETTQARSVVLISGSSTSPFFTDVADSGFFFRTVPSDALQGKVMAKKARNLGYDTASVLYVNNAYGSPLTAVFEASFEEAGGTVLESVSFDKEQGSYAPQLSQVFPADSTQWPDVVILIAYPGSGGTIISEYVLGGFETAWILGDGLKSPNFITNAGAANVNGMIGTGPYTGGPNYEAFVAAYGVEFGEDPRTHIYAESYYDAMMLLALAIEKAGEATGPAIRDALKSVSGPSGEVVNVGQFANGVAELAAGRDINYEGAAGPVDFDEVGDVIADYEVWKIEGGQIVHVETIRP